MEQQQQSLELLANAIELAKNVKNDYYNENKDVIDNFEDMKKNIRGHKKNILEALNSYDIDSFTHNDKTYARRVKKTQYHDRGKLISLLKDQYMVDDYINNATKYSKTMSESKPKQRKE